MAISADEPDTRLEGEEHEKQEHGMKRRHSEEPEEEIEAKRQRTSPGKNSPTPNRDEAAAGARDDKGTPKEESKPIGSGDARRKSSTVDEKGRSKRLFGALLGNLRQPGDRTSKRRQEIEERRKAELEKQDHERLEDRQRRQEQLAEQRKITQVRVDEENMHRRHRAMLDKSNFLQTVCEPVLFYRPWDLRDEEEDRIDDQIKDVQEIIDKEVSEFKQRHDHGDDARNGRTNDEAGKEQSMSRLEADAKNAIDNAAQNGENGPGQDQASAKSDHGETTAILDAPDDVPAPATNIDTNHEENVKMKDRPVSRGGGEEGGDDAEHIQEGDVDAVIY